MADEEQVTLHRLVIDDTSYETRLTAKFKTRKSWTPPDPKQLLAFIPGVIRQVHVEAGQSVTRGAPLLVLEAMKMENAVEAPLSGVIASVDVKPGQQVAKGQLLIRFE